MGQVIKKFNVPSCTTPEIFKHVISATYMAWIQNSSARQPTIEDVMAFAKATSKATVAEIMDTEEFRVAIRARGVPWGDTRGLNTRQLLCLNVVTNPTDRRNLGAKLKAMKISYTEYRAWLKDPMFANEVQRISEAMLGDHIADVHTAVAGKAINGDLNAAKLVYELTGRHDPAARQVQDMRVIINLLLEILTKHVTDPATLMAVSNELSTRIPKSIMGEIVS